MRLAPALTLAFAATVIACSSSSSSTSDTTTSSVASSGSGGATSSSETSGPGPSSSSATTGSGGAGGAAGDTWTNYADQFFMTYCVECHAAGNANGHDFTQYAIVVTNKATIRCGVASKLEAGCSGSPVPKQFPISDAMGTNPKPSDAERDRIVAWIDDGAPQ